MKKIIFILLISIPISVFSQIDVNILASLENYKKIELKNGMKILFLKTDSSNYNYISYRFIVDYTPFVEKEKAGNSKIMAYILGGELDGKNRFIKNMTSDENAMDSTLNFLANIVTMPNFTNKNIKDTKSYYSRQLVPVEDSLINYLSKEFRFGNEHPFAEKMDLKTLNNTNKTSLFESYYQIFKPENSYLIIVGNTNIEKIYLYANKYFGNWNKIIEPEVIEYKVNKPNDKIVKFVNKKTSSAYLSITYPINFSFNDVDFIATKILNEILYQKINEKYRTGYGNDEQIETIISENDYIGSFIVKLKLPDNQLKTKVNEVYKVLEKIKLGEINDKNIAKAKNRLKQNYIQSFLISYNIADYVYNLEKYDLEKNYYTNYLTSIDKVSKEEVRRVANKYITPEKSYCIVLGDENKLSCELVYIAKKTKVEYYNYKDTKPYKILKKGFGSKTIINDYLKNCHAPDESYNIIINFTADYLIDTTKYSLTGKIYKKYPAFHYYKTELILESDTLFHQLEVCNGEAWLDSIVTGKQIIKEEELYRKIYKAYLFPEQFFEDLNFKTRLICDTSVSNNKEYKIEVKTPSNIIYYEYYNQNTKLKVKTEKLEFIDGKYKHTETYEYSDYKKIDDRTKIKIPFIIKQTYKNISIVITINNIDTKTKIPNKIFKLK